MAGIGGFIGWVVKRQSGSHLTLSRTGRADFLFAFHDDEEIRAQDVDPDRQAHRLQP